MSCFLGCIASLARPHSLVSDFGFVTAIRNSFPGLVHFLETGPGADYAAVTRPFNFERFNELVRTLKVGSSFFFYFFNLCSVCEFSTCLPSFSTRSRQSTAR